MGDSNDHPNHFVSNTMCIAMCVQVVGHGVISPTLPGSHAFLTAAILSPGALGVPASEEATARRLATLAKVRNVITHSCCHEHRLGQPFSKSPITVQTA
jgi:hypothetical protein